MEPGDNYINLGYISCLGLYYLTKDKTSKVLTFPVYKHCSADRYIYKHPSSEGWRIGKEENLIGTSAGAYWFKGSKINPKKSGVEVKNDR